MNLLMLFARLSTWPRLPRALRGWLAVVGAGIIRRRFRRQDRRDEREAAGFSPVVGEDECLYLVDAAHGGVTFWDWIILPGGGLWYTYNWPVVGRTLVERILRYPELRAALELDGHSYEEMARRIPRAMAKTRRAVATGRLEVVNGTYGQPLAQTVSGESFVRHLAYGLATIEKVMGVRVEAYLAQEPQFFPQLPQVLRGFGYRAAVLRTHWAPFGSDPATDASLVRWRGPDGSEILTVPRYTFMDYELARASHESVPAGGLTGGDLFAWDRARTLAFAAEARARGISHPLLTRASDLKQPEAPLEHAVARAASGEIRFTTLREYLDLPHPEPPTVSHGSQDIPSTIPWGLGGDLLQRECAGAESALLAAERLDALAFSLGRPSQEEALDRAWKSLLLAQHHDLHVCGPSTSLRHGRAASDVACDMAREAAAMADRVARGGLASLAARIDTSWVRGAPLLLFNPNPWARRDYVEFSVPAEGADIVGEDGQPLAAQVVARRKEAVTLGLIAEVPALGYRLLDIRPAVAPPEETARTEAAPSSPSGEATLDERGCLRLEADGRPLLTRSLYLTVWKDGAWHDSREDSRASLEEDGPVFRRYRVEGSLAGMPFRQWVTMYNCLARIDVRLELEFGDWSLFGPSGPNREDEAPYYLQDERKLCLNLDSPLQCCVVDAPFLLAEAAPTRSGLTAITWAGLEAPDGSGLALLHRGTMGCHVDREAGLLRNVLAWAPLRWLYASADYVRGIPSLHTILRGTHTYEFALVPYARRAEGVRAAADYRLPLMAMIVGKGSGHLPSRASFLEVEPTEVTLSALFARGGAVYARLWNASEEAREAALCSGSDLGLAAVRLDLAEETPIDRATLRSWGVQTLRLEGLRARREP